MRYPTLALMCAGSLVLLGGCGGKQAEPAAAAPKDPCHDSDIEAKRVWNEKTKVKVKGQVMAWGGELGVDVAQQKAEEIENSMDRLAEDWALMRRAVCRDYMEREVLTKEEYKTRTDCLDRLLVRQRTFLDSLTSPSVDVSAQLAGINEELATCR